MGRPDGDSQDRIPAEPKGNPTQKSNARFLFVVDGDQSNKVLPLVCDLVADAGGDLMIGSPVILPDQTSLEAPGPRRAGERLAAKFVMKVKQQYESGVPVDQVVVTGHDRDNIVHTMVDRYDITTFITEDYPRSGIRSLLGFEAIDEAAVPDTCDTIVVVRIEYLEAIESILVPVARGPHSGLAIETGLALAKQNKASLELLHVYSNDDDEGLSKGEHVLETATDLLNGYEPAEQTLIEAENIPETIINHAQPFDITVFGAPREGRLRQFMLGSIPEEVSEAAEGTVLIAHKAGAHESWIDKWV